MVKTSLGSSWFCKAASIPKFTQTLSTSSSAPRPAPGVPWLGPPAGSPGWDLWLVPWLGPLARTSGWVPWLGPLAGYTGWFLSWDLWLTRLVRWLISRQFGLGRHCGIQSGICATVLYLACLWRLGLVDRSLANGLVLWRTC